MKLERINLENEYLVDMITNNGFVIKKEDKFAPTNVDQLINSSKFMDSEYRCDCGAFIGQDILGQKCPRCGSEITLHSLNFGYTGWIDIAPHKVIAPIYYNILKRAIGNSMLKFVLGDYKADHAVKYNENDKSFEENQKSKKAGMIAANDIRYIIKKIPKAKQIYQGIGHDEFYKRFDEILDACTSKTNEEDIAILKKEKSAVFTSKIPIYSTAFRPVSKTAETMFYPKINKWFSMIASIQCKLEDMLLPIEVIPAINAIQNYWIEAVDHLIKNDISKKAGFIRAEIVGGTFTFSGRSVITLDPGLNADEVDIPLPMAITAYQYKITHMLAVRYHMTLEQAYLKVQNYEDDELVLSMLDEIIAQGQWIFILREPTINFPSIACMKIRRYKKNDDTISLPLEPLEGFNADFDGDALNCCFLPKEVVPEFMAFHYSCMTDYINEKIYISLREWTDISLGCISE
jgi:DNA-directed RNA polymerase beta' subunit